MLPQRHVADIPNKRSTTEWLCKLSVVDRLSRVTVVEDELDLVFSALADPTRRAILERLAQGDATVNQLAEPFAMTQQAVSKHLKVLERAQLISRTRTAQSRPCVLDSERLDTAAGWIASHRQVWADRHDRLDEHLTALQTRQHREGKRR
jgi:DNA-binding transcriptional ArsR family regulator